MTKERLKEIHQAVAVNAFYSAGEAFGSGSDISHVEMVELVDLAKKGLESEGE
jgi:hypothetical protein